MRISGPITVSALVVAGLVASGSAAHSTARPGAPKAPEARLAAATAPSDHTAAASDQAVGLVPAAPEPPRKLRAMTPPADGVPLFGGTVPLRDIALPAGGTLGIPEVVLAAYRNAELALQSTMPGCGLTWHLLAGIGKVESNHAGFGRTDANGTTVGVIYGPALDGTLPGNEIIKAADGGFVRAVGPMQFLPGTWSLYASDGNGDGVPDPNNVFDATLGAGKYLCSGGLDLRDPQQELRAVLRYNNSLAYAAQVLSWSNAYKTGGAPTPVQISPDLVPPGAMPEGAGSSMLAANGSYPSQTTTSEPPAPAPSTTTTTEPPAQVMINIPGLPPIPCGIFCPPPPPKPNSCDPAAVPAPMPKPGEPGRPVEEQQWAAEGQPQPGSDPHADPNKPTDPNAKPHDPNAAPQPAGCVAPQGQPAPGLPGAPAPAPAAPAPAPAPEQQPQMPAKTPEPGPVAPAEPVPSEAPVAPPAPAITLPFGIVVPLPAPPQ
ncbi:lytic murein transglycosylase [Nocardia transvalensis]|uniref:lytic murein transglycosylase n=1 Tax=Nocardia transvalensis TaxID=37333 RepID=UPI0018940090|nr:lytic murein transglycosylase [Nocardia transvalensis]MBF6327294.1 lytic murein transglycosylase [Nocardia transvalensis]